MKNNCLNSVGVFCFFVSFFIIICSAYSEESKRFSGENYSLIFHENGTVDICFKGQKGDTPVGRVGEFAFPAANIKTTAKAVIETELKPLSANEKVNFDNIMTAVVVQKSTWPQVVVKYPLDSGSITAKWTLMPEWVHVQYQISPAQENPLVDGPATLAFQMCEKLPQVEQIKPARWFKHHSGGVPYQLTAGMAERYTLGRKSVIIANDHGLPQLFDPAKNEISLFARTAKRPWMVDRLEANLVFSFKQSPEAMPLAIAAAGEELLMLNLKSPQSFYLWKKVDEPIELKGTAVNLASRPQRVDIDYIARDYDGNIIGQQTLSRQLKPLGQWEFPIRLTAKDVGPIFLEVQAQNDLATTFENLTVGVLPERDFKDKENSRFGIPGYRGCVGSHTELRTEKEIFELMRRLGVRWLRQAGDRQLAHEMGFFTWYNNSVFGPEFQNYIQGNPVWMNDPKNREDWLRANFQRTIDQKDVCFEFSNEWNLHGGENKGLLAERYVRDWMIPLKKIRDQVNPNIKLAGCVIANGDLVYLEKVYNAGGWDTFDLLDFHAYGMPRTPDFDDGESYWSYLGTLRRVHEAMRKYGKKDLWMTEFYAATAPNSSCSISEREAAEDIALMHGLAVAADVKGTMLHCLDDYDLYEEIKTSAQIGEPVERECYFGLVRRDWTPKLGLWSYQTSAYYLDGAVFLGDIVVSDKDINGLLFKTNRGTVAMLWNRKEGYRQHEASHPRRTHRLPWKKSWTIGTPITLAGKSAVTVVDCIGRSRQVSPDQNGRITLEITGSPIYVVGGDFKTYNGRYSKMFKQ